MGIPVNIKEDGHVLALFSTYGKTTLFPQSFAHNIIDVKTVTVVQGIGHKWSVVGPKACR